MPLTDIATFSVRHLQVLDEHGKLDADLDPNLPEDVLVRLYRGMVLAREADERMLKLQRQGRIGTFALNSGQEAAQVGPALAMTQQDWLVPAFRELGARLARGLPLVKDLLFYNGFEEGSVAPEAGRTLPISIIVGSQTLHAVGLAYALQYRGETDAAVVTFLGDGGTSEGEFYEALNFAGVWKAPVVFIVQNNHWAISIPRSRQTASQTLAQKAIAAGIECLSVDGNDALAMYRAADEALKRARSGGGPTLIEAVTYRLLMHTTSDDPSRYRTDEEAQAWWARDPIPRLAAYMAGRGLWDEAREQALRASVRAEVDAAVKEMEATTGMKPDAAFDFVYGTRHDGIEQQRAEFLSGLKAGG